jgi:hypothetical protein
MRQPEMSATAKPTKPKRALLAMNATETKDLSKISFKRKNTADT